MPLHDISYSLGPWQTWVPSTVGWSSFTTQIGAYLVIAQTVFCRFILQGTSDSTTTTFTPPVASTSFGDYIVRVRDNGTFKVGMVELNSGTFSCYTDTAGSAFSASGTKEVIGSLFYQIV